MFDVKMQSEQLVYLIWSWYQRFRNCALINLSPAVCQLFTKIINNKIYKTVDSAQLSVAFRQAEFRSGFSTLGYIHTIRVVVRNISTTSGINRHWKSFLFNIPQRVISPKLLTATFKHLLKIRLKQQRSKNRWRISESPRIYWCHRELLTILTKYKNWPTIWRKQPIK